MKTLQEGKDGITYLNTNFKEHFGNMEVKGSFKKSDIKSVTLPRDMNDKEIIAEFGPEEVTLGFLFYALKRADKSDWYLFHIRDSEGTLWAVRAFWHAGSDGWRVGAASVTDPRRWRAGHQFLSRGFFATQTPQTLGSSDTLPEELIINGKKYRAV